MIFTGILFTVISIGLIIFQLFNDITDDLCFFPLIEYITIACIVLAFAAFVFHKLLKMYRIGFKLAAAVVVIAIVSATVPSVATGIHDCNQAFTLSCGNIRASYGGDEIIERTFSFPDEQEANIVYYECTSAISSVEGEGYNYGYNYYKTLNPVFRLAALIQLNPASQIYTPGFSQPVSMKTYRENGKTVVVFTDGSAVQVIAMSYKSIYIVNIYNTATDDESLAKLKDNAVKQSVALDAVQKADMKNIYKELYG